MRPHQYGDEGLFDYDLMVVTDPDEGTIDERLAETVKISDAEAEQHSIQRP